MSKQTIRVSDATFREIIAQHGFVVTGEPLPVSWDNWYLAAMDLWREQCFHSLTGNMQDAPGVEIFQRCFRDGQSPSEALEAYKAADSAFFATNRSDPC